MPHSTETNAAGLRAEIEHEARQLAHAAHADAVPEVVFSRCARRLRELATRADALADIYQD